jgi:hypothetical protein
MDIPDQILEPGLETFGLGSPGSEIPKGLVKPNFSSLAMN